MSKPNIVLTVQPVGKRNDKKNAKFRLGAGLYDSQNIFFNKRGLKVVFILPDGSIETRTTSGPPNKKGFDLYNRAINHWLKINKFCNYPKGLPTKLEFNVVNHSTKMVTLEYLYSL